MNIRKIREELGGGRSIFDLPLRVTFYARVSTDKPEQQGSLENQIQYYTDFIQKNQNWSYVPGYVDEGISGASTFKRESFLRMIEDGEREKFDYIITKEISRFSRNTLDSIQYTRRLLDAGVGVLFQSDNINTLDTDSEFRLVVMAGVAQDELRKLSERLKFGFRQSIKNGRVLGNDRLWGYDKKDCKLSIIPRQAEAVRLAFELYATGNYGLRKLSQELSARGYKSLQGNDFNAVTLGHMLQNPKYKGWYCGNKTKSLDYRKKKTLFLDEEEWVTYPDPKIPALVSEELWERANSLYKKRSQRAKALGVGYQSRYPYSGKIICGRHNTSFHRQSFQTVGGVREFWKCKVCREKGKEGCDMPSLHTEELSAVLAELFGKTVRSGEEIIRLVLKSLKESPGGTDNAPRLERAEGQIRQLEAKKDKLLELSVENAISMPEFKERNSKLNEQLEELKGQIRDLQKPSQTQSVAFWDATEVEKALREELDFRAGIAPEVVTAIFDHVVVREGSGAKKILLEIHLQGGAVEFAELNREPFVFSISSSRNTIPNAQSWTT
ncbi:MAG: recombinase family protein [Oscillospiraceae bacterium]